MTRLDGFPAQTALDKYLGRRGKVVILMLKVRSVEEYDEANSERRSLLEQQEVGDHAVRNISSDLQCRGVLVGNHCAFDGRKELPVPLVAVEQDVVGIVRRGRQACS